MLDNINIEDDVFKNYAICTAILVMKVLLMGPLTSRIRLTRKIFSSPEDPKFFGNNPDNKIEDPDIERIRRAHLNDLENIPAFIFIGGLYILTSPETAAAVWLMRVYTGSRILHTLVYAFYPIPQPTRAISWIIGYGITFYMAGAVALHFS